MAEALQEVYSLLVPLQGGRLIVPRTTVAEVTGYTKPKDRPADAPSFLLGFFDWQGQKIPMISFEAAGGLAVPPHSRRTRIAVLYGIGGKLNPPAFALMTQGYPYLVRINPNVLQIETSDPEALTGPSLVQLRIANERPVIPDIEALEDMIIDALGIQAAESPTFDFTGTGTGTGYGTDTDFQI